MQKNGKTMDKVRKHLFKKENRTLLVVHCKLLSYCKAFFRETTLFSDTYKIMNELRCKNEIMVEDYLRVSLVPEAERLLPEVYPTK